MRSATLAAMPSESDELLALAEVRLHEAERKLRLAEEEYTEAKGDRDAIRRLVAKHRGGPLPMPDPLSSYERMTRSGAIVTLLREVEIPLSPKEIAERLREKGRSKETAALVSNTLWKLKDTGEVVSPARGVWTARTLRSVPSPSQPQLVEEGK
jgi:hypothetical protein